MEDQLQYEQEKDTIEFEQNQVFLTPGQLIMKRFLRNKLAILGLVVIVGIMLFG